MRRALAAALVPWKTMATFAAPRYDEVTRFAPGDADALAHLDEHGYVVFDALTAEEADAAVGKFWDHVEGLGSGVDRGDASTWTDDRWPPGVGATGILPWFNVGHSDLQWFVRTRPRVAAAFRAVWRAAADEPMVASFDGCCAWRPGAATADGWLHVDQDARRGGGFEMVQGLVALTDVVEGRGGNALVAGSHRSVFPRLLEAFGPELAANGGDDYFELPRPDHICERDAVCCLLRKGDLLLWDSRLVHASTPSRAADPPPADELARCCSFQCMVPARLCPPEVRAARRAAFEDGVTTSHWPTKLVRTDGYDSFRELPAAVRLRFAEPPSVPWTPDIGALL